MSDDFDPYLQWLGIQPHERPADHYRLLGLARFDSDTVRIASAADERMIHIRQFQTGPRGELTQQLLNAVSSAKLCLLDPNTKATYDAVLQGQFSTSPVESVPTAAPHESHLPPAAGTGASTVPNASPAPPVKEIPTAKPVVDPEFDDTLPFYTRGWFPIVVVAAIVFIVGSVWGIGRIISQRNSTADVIAGDKNDEKSTVSHGEDSESPKQHTDSDEKDPSSNNAISILQEADGSWNFPATLATIHGSTPKLETRGNKSVITGWSSKDDWLSWRFNVVKAGIFRVQVTYAAVESSADGRFEVAVGDRTKSVDVRSGKTPGAFVTDEFYLLIERSGQNTLKLRAVEFVGDELMTFESIRIEPRK